MALYELTDSAFRSIQETTFAAAGISERRDLQRRVRQQIDVISPETLVIAEEFGEWEDSRRRIDLLGVDRDANLVVIELKRTEVGGHMELQSIRYAAMVSAMTFETAVDTFEDYLRQLGRDEDAEETILEFLGWDEPNEDEFAQDVRILLASAEFSKELTTSVMWLNERGLNITCMRLKPYRDGDRLLLDVQQIIPLPEAEDYRVRLRNKQERERVSRRFRRDSTRYNVTIGEQTYENLPKRQAVFAIVKQLCDSGVSPEKIAEYVPWRKFQTMFRMVEGTVDPEQFVATVERQDSSSKAKRFFCGEEELIHSGEKTYALTKMWGPRTYKAIQNLIEAFPDEDMSCSPSAGHTEQQEVRREKLLNHLRQRAGREFTAAELVHATKVPKALVSHLLDNVEDVSISEKNGKKVYSVRQLPEM